MSCYSKEKIEKCDFTKICKSHSARSDREMYRICPSKLSKRELEDLYFTLLESNLDLKKKINGQQDKIRGLSTRVQRLTAAQKSLRSKEMKECCVGTKSLIDEQNESITELKLANEQMAEKIRKLNMRLSSAKQFCKKASGLSASTSTPKKHDCLSKPSVPSIIKCSVSCQNVARSPVMKSVQTETSELQETNADSPCDENKCRTAMEELKEKILNLQEELCQTHDEYSSRIGRLENEVSDVRKENVRVRTERAASEHELQTTVHRTSDLLTNLRTAEARNAELATQLSIEKRRVAELETRLKSANMSDRVSKTIEEHLVTINEPKCRSIPKCICACHLPVKNEMAESPPKKKLKCHVCLCPPAQPQGDKNGVKSAPIKDAKHHSPPAKDVESVNSSLTKKSKCACPPPPPSPPLIASPPSVAASPPSVAASPPSVAASPPSVAASPELSPIKCPDDCKWSGASNDSGYMERSHEKDVIALNKLNQELIKKVIELQNQLDKMKIVGTTKLPVCDKSCEKDGTSYATSTPKSQEKSKEKSKEKPAGEKSKKKSGKQKSPPDENREQHKPESVLAPLALPAKAELQELAELPDDVSPDDQKLKDEQEIIEKSGVNEPRASDKPTNGMLEAENSEPNDTKELVLGNQKQRDDREKFENGEPIKPEFATEKPKEHFEVRESLDQSTSESHEIRNEMLTDDLEALKTRQPNKPDSLLDKPTLTIVDKRETYKPKLGLSARELRDELELFESQSHDVNKTGMVPRQRLLMLDDCESNKTAESNKTTESINLSGIRDPDYINQKAMNEYRGTNNEISYQLRMNGGIGRRTSKSDIIFGKPQLATDIHQVPNKIEMLPGNLKLPMTDGLTASAEEGKPDPRDPSTKKERCKSCSKCRYQSECAAMPYCNDDNLKCDLGARIVNGIKNDQHNSLQIPGPIPTADSSTKDWKKSVLRHFSFESKRKDSLKNKDKSKQKKTSNVKDTASDAVPMLGFNRGTDTGTDEQTNIDEGFDGSARECRQQQRRRSTFSKDSFETHHKRLSKFMEERSVRLSDRIHLNDSYTPSDQPMSIAYNMNDESTQMEQKSGPMPEEERLLEHTIGVEIEGSDVRTVIQQPEMSTSEKGTYTVMSEKQMRGPSPDTEGEISSMTDLPSEADAKSPFKERRLSPGEDKMTSTYSESQSSPATPTPHSLSEGEIPGNSHRRSYEQQKQDKATEPVLREASAQKMEAALLAITDELARCKNLMLGQRPAEVAGAQSQGVSTAASRSSLSSDPRSIALRPGVATQSIGDTHAPRCIFTLHIGTLVLSDEAVLNSRDKNLVLTWTFYDQNTAMTRMRAGRVVLFDYSTEYDIKITDEFLDYMKTEEMPIVICELDKPDQPFAICKLPLRDALLHTNRRADMSLALLAGPQMARARAAGGRDALDAGDELGVVDLWCLLRADTKLLPLINRAIARSAKGHRVTKSVDLPTPQMLQQVVDDEAFNEFVDMDLSLEKRCAAPVSVGQQTGTNVCKDVAYTRTSRPWDCDVWKKYAAKEPVGTQTQTIPTRAEQLYDPSRYPPVRPRHGSEERGPPAPPRPSHADPEIPTSDQPPSRDASGIIINEVEAKIKLPGDLKYALDKSSIQHQYTRLPDEETVSQPHSSFSSLRSVLARLQRRGSNKDKQRPGGFIQNMRKQSEEDRNDMDIYKKYDNISKLIGPNRAETSKKVTIVPDYNRTVMEEPQKDTVENPSVASESKNQRLDVTVLWLALNEECEAMVDPHVQRVYVAYTFLGRSGAELETPMSLPKPKHYVDKCYFNFKKTFVLDDSDLPMLGHMARCRSASKVSEDPRDCIVFSVVSEPTEDPLGLENCEDIGYAYLYLGDLLAYSAGSSGYTEVVPVRAARNASSVCGVLAVRLDGLDVVRRCLLLSSSQRDLADWNMT